MRARPAEILLVSLMAAAIPSRPAHANGGADTPAVPVPQYSPDEAPGVSLWPVDAETGRVMLRPADVAEGTTRSELSPLPAERDSTDYITQSAPGLVSGHELFQDVGVPNQRDEDIGQSDWLVAVYNAGVQVWRLEDPELPMRGEVRDGWTPPLGRGDWATFAAFGEMDTFVKNVDVLQVGTTIYIGVSAETFVGFSAWTLDPSDGTLTQIYQDLNASSHDVSMVEDPNGRIYAFASSRGSGGGDGVRVYDLSAAAEANTVCVDVVGSSSCDVFRGIVGSIPRVSFVSALVVDGATFVATADGSAINDPLTLEIWEVSDPDDPTLASEPRFSGFGSRVHSPQLFTYGEHHYLALVDKSAGQQVAGQMRIYDVGHCLDGDGCVDLGAPLATETLVYSAAGHHYLDLSFSAGVPFLHYGMETTGLFGSGFERLWNLSGLPEAFATDTLPELTDGGGSYPDPCSGEAVDYFGDYYINNEYGLDFFNPRHAVFTGPYLYRAATSVLDVHVRALEDCGNGTVEAGEECDDGNATDDDACSNQCTLPICGDEIVQAGEECDGPDDPSCVDCMLVVESSGGADDSASDGAVDSASDGTGSGGTSDGGAADGPGDGCGCTSGDSGGSGVAFGLLGLLGLWRRRRLVPRI